MEPFSLLAFSLLNEAGLDNGAPCEDSSSTFRYLNLETSNVSTRQLFFLPYELKACNIVHTFESKTQVPCQERHSCIHQRWTLTRQHRRVPLDEMIPGIATISSSMTLTSYKLNQLAFTIDVKACASSSKAHNYINYHYVNTEKEKNSHS
jgi:hypothetical protein